MTPKTPPDGATLLGRLIRNPSPVPWARWISHWHAGAPLSRQQEKLLDRLAGARRIAVPKGHATGGTYVVNAWLLKELALHKRIKIISTGASWSTVELVTWDVLRQQITAAERGGYRFPSPNQTDMHVGPARWIEGISTNDLARVLGHHEERTIVVMEEAAGIKRPIWSGFEAALSTGHPTIVALSQPFSPVGPFYDVCQPGSGWDVVTMDCFDSPNLEGVTLPGLLEMDDAQLDEMPHPFLVTRRWVRDMANPKRCGPDSPLWVAQVRGRFPKEDEHTLFPLSWLETAAAPADDPGGQVTVGLDVAGPGRNETVCYVLAGDPAGEMVVVAMGTWRQMDARGEVLAFLQPWRPRIRRVNVDEPGIGYYMLQHLKDEKLPVHGFNGGLPADDPERFADLRAEALWNVRDLMEDGRLSGVTDEETRAQMAPIRWAPNPKGKTQVESKKTAGRDWDRIDALALAAWAPHEPVVYVGKFYSDERELQQLRHQMGTERPSGGAGSLRGRDW